MALPKKIEKHYDPRTIRVHEQIEYQGEVVPVPVVRSATMVDCANCVASQNEWEEVEVRKAQFFTPAMALLTGGPKEYFEGLAEQGRDWPVDGYIPLAALLSIGVLKEVPWGGQEIDVVPFCWPCYMIAARTAA